MDVFSCVILRRLEQNLKIDYESNSLLITNQDFLLTCAQAKILSAMESIVVGIRT